MFKYTAIMWIFFALITTDLRSSDTDQDIIEKKSGKTFIQRLFRTDDLIGSSDFVTNASVFIYTSDALGQVARTLGSEDVEDFFGKISLTAIPIKSFEAIFLARSDDAFKQTKRYQIRKRANNYFWMHYLAYAGSFINRYFGGGFYPTIALSTARIGLAYTELMTLADLASLDEKED